MPRQATSAEPAAGREDVREVSELREELARSQEEVLRLRDLLIGKDAEMGAMRGRLAELEEGRMRFLSAARRVRGRLPSFVSKARAGLRKLRPPQG